MRVVIITQDEPFYLRNNLDYLFSIFPKSCEVVGCVVNDVSPFGKTETFFSKALTPLTVFGLRFFIHYSFKYLIQKFKNNNIRSLLKCKKVPEIKLSSSINSKKSLDEIKSYQPDLLISILGNQIFKKPLIELAPKGCINLHTALLPKYRGLMPTFWVLKNDENHTGVSVFFVDEGIDSGPIIVQKLIQINGQSQAELIRESKRIGMEAIAEAVDFIYRDSVNLIENDDLQKSYYSFPTRKDVREFRMSGKRFF